MNGAFSAILGVIMSDDTIATNKRSKFDYTLLEFFEAGMVLQGWELKSIRSGKANIAQAHILCRGSEMWLIGSLITPLLQASSHLKTEATRTRKLLLHRKQINKLMGQVAQKGLTIVPVRMYWKKDRVKLNIALAKGKKLHDKRESIKEREWNRNKQRILKGG